MGLMRMGLVGVLALGGCAAALAPSSEQAAYETLVNAPPSPVLEQRRRPGAGSTDEGAANPDEATLRDALALNARLRAEGGPDYVGYRIVRDPRPRVAFHFRRDASAALARFTADPRFVAVNGGVPPAELEPLFEEWRARFEPHRIWGGGAVMEFEGEVRFEMTVDQAAFRAIAAREGWVVPERLRLNFPAVQNPRPVDPALASRVRVLARQDRADAAVNQAALSGRLILRDGCFRMQQADGSEPLVLFGRDAELGLDATGHLAVSDRRMGTTARVGERVIWSGPRGVNPRDQGVQALRRACGDDSIVAVGEPSGAARFEAERARRR